MHPILVVVMVDVYKVHRSKLTPNVIKLDTFQVIWIKKCLVQLFQVHLQNPHLVCSIFFWNLYLKPMFCEHANNSFPCYTYIIVRKPCIVIESKLKTNKWWIQTYKITLIKNIFMNKPLISFFYKFIEALLIECFLIW